MILNLILISDLDNFVRIPLMRVPVFSTPATAEKVIIHFIFLLIRLLKNFYFVKFMTGLCLFIDKTLRIHVNDQILQIEINLSPPLSQKHSCFRQNFLKKAQ